MKMKKKERGGIRRKPNLTAILLNAQSPCAEGHEVVLNPGKYRKEYLTESEIRELIEKNKISFCKAYLRGFLDREPTKKEIADEKKRRDLKGWIPAKKEKKKWQEIRQIYRRAMNTFWEGPDRIVESTLPDKGKELTDE